MLQLLGESIVPLVVCGVIEGIIIIAAIVLEFRYDKNAIPGAGSPDNFPSVNPVFALSFKKKVTRRTYREDPEPSSHRPVGVLSSRSALEERSTTDRVALSPHGSIIRKAGSLNRADSQKSSKRGARNTDDDDDDDDAGSDGGDDKVRTAPVSSSRSGGKRKPLSSA
jgi:hypothetical protein